MLMDHHNNRWQIIMARKNVETRIDETKKLIDLYKISCFSTVKQINQYENDLVRIKLLI